LARLFRERRTQLPQVSGIDVGNSPELQAPLTPTQQMVAIVARLDRYDFLGADRPDKHVDDVLPSSIYDSRDHSFVYVVESAADQGKAPVGKLEHRRREVHLAREPWLDHMSIRRLHVDEMGSK
jgi:hypothetical protein